MKRIFLRLKQPLRNERGEITFFACFFVVGIVMLISFLLLYASIRITCINIRNGAKMELNNLSGTIYADTYRSQRETNFEEYLNTLYSSSDYEEKQQSATITVLASPEQAKIITGLENDGVAHVALISRNNDKLADELLAEQDKTLQEIYFPETLIEEEAADAKNSDVESEPQETETAESAQSTNETAPSAE